ncbi:hypothetical protein NDU88_005206 [Pleurodeles waltl]|uniref:Uncharacterized protein n=1 Tax=Pleurodeles waltl TaxID=8319 RepID=A0AAV7M9B4_PLEWA|nr:hypothetical protein NDU88_005206 [Pleurodeles waltl]
MQPSGPLPRAGRDAVLRARLSVQLAAWGVRRKTLRYRHSARIRGAVLCCFGPATRFPSPHSNPMPIQVNSQSVQFTAARADNPCTVAGPPLGPRAPPTARSHWSAQALWHAHTLTACRSRRTTVIHKGEGDWADPVEPLREVAWRTALLSSRARERKAKKGIQKEKGKYRKAVTKGQFKEKEETTRVRQRDRQCRVVEERGMM